MKKFLFPFMTALFSLLPLHESGAADFGGFKVGQSFKLKVAKITSIKLQGSKERKIPVPGNVPKYAKGQTIAFDIVRKGALHTGKFSIPFVRDCGDSNLYNQVGYGVKNDSAYIDKSPAHKATSGSLIFIRNTVTASKRPSTKSPTRWKNPERGSSHDAQAEPPIQPECPAEPAPVHPGGGAASPKIARKPLPGMRSRSKYRRKEAEKPGRQKARHLAGPGWPESPWGADSLARLSGHP